MGELMLWDELRAIRLHLGLTQAALGKAVGLSRTFVGLMERGDRPISRRTATAIRSLRPSALEQKSTDPDPTTRRLEEALISQGMEYQTRYESDGYVFDFYLPELSLAIVVDREATIAPPPTRDVRNLIIARGTGAPDILSTLLNGRPLRMAAPLFKPLAP